MTVEERTQEMWTRAARAGYARHLAWPPKEAFFVMVAAATHCAYCGRRMTHSDPHPFGRRPSPDHRIPFVQGGTNVITNFAMACWRCNLMKGTVTEAVFRALIKNASEEVLEAYFTEAHIGLYSQRRRNLIRQSRGIPRDEYGILDKPVEPHEKPCQSCGIPRGGCFRDPAGCCPTCSHDPYGAD